MELFGIVINVGIPLPQYLHELVVVHAFVPIETPVTEPDCPTPKHDPSPRHDPLLIVTVVIDDPANSPIDSHALFPKHELLPILT